MNNDDLDCLKTKSLRHSSSLRNLYSRESLCKRLPANLGTRKDEFGQETGGSWKREQERNGTYHESHKEHGENGDCQRLRRRQDKSSNYEGVSCKNASSREKSWPHARISGCFGNTEAGRIVSCRYQSDRNRVPSISRSIEKPSNSLSLSSDGQPLSSFRLEAPSTVETPVGCISGKESHVSAERLSETEPVCVNLKKPQKFSTTFASDIKPDETAPHFSGLTRNDISVTCNRLKHSKARGRNILDVPDRSLSCGISDPIQKSCRLPNITDTLTSNSSEKSLSQPCSDVEALPLLIEQETSGKSFDSVSTDPDSDRLSSGFTGELGIQVNTCYNVHPSIVLDRQNQELLITASKELAASENQPRTLSQKYRPRAFDELIGQNIVVQALSNAVIKGKIAPVYLFQGSRGTGKTSAARIFASALNCLGEEENKPCGLCRNCTVAASGKSLGVKEVDAASNNGVERVQLLLEVFICAPSSLRFKILILDECHMLTAATWNVILKTLEEPPANVVFILITTNPDSLPCTVISRCQKFTFPKIKDSDIVRRLQKLVSLEALDIEPEAIYLVASKADGSLRDAETILDQLSLLGCKINLSTVQELVGSVADEKLFNLLEVALSADTISIIQRVRELVASGIEPLSLMSQLATIIMDILVDRHSLLHETNSSFFHGQALQEDDLDRLRFALKILSEAEKQIRLSSSDQTTWLIATLLQLGGDCSVVVPPSAGMSAVQNPVEFHSIIQNAVSYDEAREPCFLDEKDGCMLDLCSVSELGNESIGNSTCQSVKLQMQHNQFIANDEHDKSATECEVTVHPVDLAQLHGKLFEVQSDYPRREEPSDSSLQLSSDSLAASPKYAIHLSPQNLEYIWSKVVDHCQSIPLRWTWHRHMKLLCISLLRTGAVVHLEYLHLEHKSKAEKFQNSISKIFQVLLGTPVSIKSTLAAPARQDETSKLHFPNNQSTILPTDFKHYAPAGISSILQAKEDIFGSVCLGSLEDRIEGTTRDISSSKSTDISAANPYSLRGVPGFMENSKVVLNTCIQPLLHDGKCSTPTAHASSASHLGNALLCETMQYLSDSEHNHYRSETDLLDHNGQSSPLGEVKMLKSSKKEPGCGKSDRYWVKSDASTASLSEYDGACNPEKESVNTVSPEEKKRMQWHSEIPNIPQKERSRKNKGFLPRKIKLLKPRRKYGLICWKFPKLYKEKEINFRLQGKCRQERCGILFCCIPCIKLGKKF